MSGFVQYGRINRGLFNSSWEIMLSCRDKMAIIIIFLKVPLGSKDPKGYYYYYTYEQDDL